jgi:hypothetical protein
VGVPLRIDVFWSTFITFTFADPGTASWRWHGWPLHQLPTAAFGAFVPRHNQA